jgi:hypothetical protein
VKNFITRNDSMLGIEHCIGTFFCKKQVTKLDALGWNIWWRIRAGRHIVLAKSASLLDHVSR